MNPFITYQNVEYFTSSKDQYLLIHKCACSTVLKAQEKAFSNIHDFEYPHNNLIKWTVLRDPYERFISGLTHDIIISCSNVTTNNIQQITDSILTEKFFNNIHQYISKYRQSGKISHVIPQSTYIFNQPIDVFVDINNLDRFIERNYNIQSFKENVGNKEMINIVGSVVEKYKQKVIDIYSMDYYIIDRIQSNGLFWEWNNGAVIQ